MLKVVLDTNQFISSIITRSGPSAQLFQAWRRYEYTLITSKEIIEEIKRVLYYPRIIKKYHLQKEDIESFVTLIEHEAVVFPNTIKLNVIKEDPEDNKILACALESKADYIVSGDSHLLSLCQYGDIVIVSARQLLEIIGYKQ